MTGVLIEFLGSVPSEQPKEMAVSSEQIRPFLFRFRAKCMSPKRALMDPNLNRGYQYDNDLCQVVKVVDGKRIPAISCSENSGLVTKKRDIEKGDDDKDRWMW